MALTETLTDNFDDNSLSASWTKGGVGASTLEQNQRIEITHTATSQYNDLNTTSTYDLTGSYVFCNVVNAGNQALTSHEVIFGARIDANNGVWMTISGNTIAAYKKVTSVQTQIGSSIAYSSTTHAWLRVIESGGTISFDTSLTGATGSWTNRWTVANPITITALKPFLQTGCWQNEASGSFGYFDSYNVAPAAATGRTNRLAMLGVA